MTPAKPDLQLVGTTPAGKPVPQVPPLVYTPGFSLYNEPLPPTQWLVEPLIPRDTIFCLNGRGGVFKSWTMTAIAIAAAGGIPLMQDQHGKPHFKCPVDPPYNSVLFIQIEERRWQTAKKYRWLLNGMRAEPEWIQDLQVGFIIDQPFRMDDPRRMDQLKIIIDDVQPDLVIWDNARKMKTGNENDSEWGDGLIFGLRELQAIYPSTHGLIHHWRKKSSDKDMNDPDEMGRGNAALRDGCDVWLPIELHQDEDPAKRFVTVYPTKTRDDEPVRPFNYRVRIHKNDGIAALEYIGVASDQLEGCAGAILDIIRSEPNREWTRTDLKPLLGTDWTDNQQEWAVTALARDRKLRIESRGRGRAAVLKLATSSDRNPTGTQPELRIPYGD
jgi:AAA domain